VVQVVVFLVSVKASFISHRIHLLGYPTSSLHGIITQKTMTLILITMKTSNLTNIVWITYFKNITLTALNSIKTSSEEQTLTIMA
jgi:hypothetical protein